MCYRLEYIYTGLNLIPIASTHTYHHHHQVESSAAAMVGQLEDLEMDELPMVKIGDASVAAPFTSKMPSIRSCVDIVRQGRCTLVTSIQMYQILALNCLISAYSLSVLYLDGVSMCRLLLLLLHICNLSSTLFSKHISQPLDTHVALQYPFGTNHTPRSNTAIRK